MSRLAYLTLVFGFRCTWFRYRTEIDGSPVNSFASSHAASMPDRPASEVANSFSLTLALGHAVIAVIGGPGVRITNPDFPRPDARRHIPLD